jgi:hypothetical protein
MGKGGNGRERRGFRFVDETARYIHSISFVTSSTA